MNVGQLNRRIKVYKQSFAIDDDFGTDEPSDELVGTYWANISPRTGSLLTGRDGGTILSQTTHAITVRSRKEITSDCWIVWTDEFEVSHTFTIDYVRPPAGDNYMIIYVKEEV